MYPDADDSELAMKDGSVAISFVSEASDQAVSPEEFISLVSEVNRGQKNFKYIRGINGYTVSMTHHQTDILTGWSIGVHK